MDLTLYVYFSKLLSIKLNYIKKSEKFIETHLNVINLRYGKLNKMTK